MRARGRPRGRLTWLGRAAVATKLMEAGDGEADEDPLDGAVHGRGARRALG